MEMLFGEMEKLFSPGQQKEKEKKRQWFITEVSLCSPKFVADSAMLFIKSGCFKVPGDEKVMGCD